MSLQTPHSYTTPYALDYFKVDFFTIDATNVNRPESLDFPVRIRGPMPSTMVRFASAPTSRLRDFRDKSSS